MYGEEIKVKTAFGDLVAQIGRDTSFPEVFVYLRRDDGAELNLCCITDESLNTGDPDEFMRVAVWNRTNSEDYHQWFDFPRREIESENAMWM